MRGVCDCNTTRSDGSKPTRFIIALTLFLSFFLSFFRRLLIFSLSID